MIYWDYNQLKKSDEDLEKQELLSKCRTAAIQYLALRTRSTGQCQKKLAADNFPNYIIEEVLQQLDKDGYLSDNEMAEFVIKSRRNSKAESHLALRRRMNNLGIRDDIIEAYLQDNVSDKVLLAELFANKFSSLFQEYVNTEEPKEKYNLKVKLIRKANNRGFTDDFCVNFLNQYANK